MSAKILVVEDEKPIADILQFNLEREGFEVECVHDGEEALRRVFADPPDLILLDLMLPKMDGIEVCRRVRQSFQMPIIMVTAKDSEVDKVLGLEMGADDYVTKPFSNRELLARIKANLRRSHQPEGGSSANILRIGDLVIDWNSYLVTKNGATVELSHREFELLSYMAKHVGQVLTREHLLRSVWGYDYFGDMRTVDVAIRRLREKIEDDPSNPEYIITRRGLGYTMRDPSADR